MSGLFGAWKCDGCHITYKGGGHSVLGSEGEIRETYCDNCWYGRPGYDGSEVEQ